MYREVVLQCVSLLFSSEYVQIIVPMYNCATVTSAELITKGTLLKIGTHRPNSVDGSRETVAESVRKREREQAGACLLYFRDFN